MISNVKASTKTKEGKKPFLGKNQHQKLEIYSQNAGIKRRNKMAFFYMAARIKYTLVKQMCWDNSPDSPLIAAEYWYKKVSYRCADSCRQHQCILGSLRAFQQNGKRGLVGWSLSTSNFRWHALSFVSACFICAYMIDKGINEKYFQKCIDYDKKKCKTLGF